MILATKKQKKRAYRNNNIPRGSLGAIVFVFHGVQLESSTGLGLDTSQSHLGENKICLKMETAAFLESENRRFADKKLEPAAKVDRIFQLCCCWAAKS
jgi:hypothetical protein